MTVRRAFVEMVSDIPNNCPLCGSHLSKAELEQEKCFKCQCQWIVKRNESEKR